MLHRLTFVTLLSAALVAPALGQVILFEDFESYTDSSALLGAWPSSVPARPDNATRLIAGDTEGDDQGAYYGGTNLTKFAQFCGSANDATGIGNCDTATGNAGVAGGGTVNYMNFPQVNPTATQKLVFSADIGDDALSANKRLTVGLRDATTPANLVEMGFYNAPIGHFSFRAQLFGAGSQVPGRPADPNADPPFAGDQGWSTFNDQTIDQPLPEVLNASFKVGRAFHRFTAEISLTEIAYSLDLYADGFRNYIETGDPENPFAKTPIGEGVAGAPDAYAVYPIITQAGGYNQIRFGPPSALASSGGTNINAAFAAFDNISLKLVDIETPTGNADFNEDGKVDGRDFLIWQRGLGTPGALLADGDANGDEAVDGLDLGVWKQQYGTGTLAAVVAVPEPTSAVLVLAMSALLAIRRK